MLWGRTIELVSFVYDMYNYFLMKVIIIILIMLFIIVIREHQE